MEIKCGNHNGQKVYHASVAEVRACYTGRTGAEPPATSVFEQASQARAAETHAWIHEGAGPRETTSNEKRVLDQLTGTDPAAFASRERYRQIWEGDATEKQISYVRSLLRGRQAPNADFRRYAGAIASAIEAGTLMKRDASRAIERMNGWAKVARTYTMDASGQGVVDPPQTLADEDGIYRNPTTGEIFKGQFNRASGDGRALYFKRLILVTADGDLTDIPLSGDKPGGHLDWIYVGSAGKAKVEKAWRVTRAEAEAFGSLYGVCIRCHRTLTLEESIDRAMGRICASKMAW